MIGKLMPDAASDPSSLLVVGVANAFALSSAVYIAAGISGGHVNPAVTFGLTVGGHIRIPTAIFYCISQMLGATVACLFLRFTAVGQVNYQINLISHFLNHFLYIDKTVYIKI